MIVEQPFYDKKGKEIKMYSLLKMYHFTSGRRKKHYMYKWVKIKEFDGKRFYIANHLDGTESWFSLHSIADPETRVIKNCEVIQGAGK